MSKDAFVTIREQLTQLKKHPMSDWIHDPRTGLRIRKDAIAAYSDYQGGSCLWVQGHTELVLLSLTVHKLDQLLDISTDDE